MNENGKKMLREAIHSTVHGFNGGVDGAIEELAAKMTQAGHKMSPAILRNKACKTNHNHHFHPEQLQALQDITKNTSITDAYVSMNTKSGDSEASIESELFDMTSSLGRLFDEAKAALEDGTINVSERIRCLKPLTEIEKKASNIKAQLHGKAPIRAAN